VDEEPVASSGKGESSSSSSSIGGVLVSRHSRSPDYAASLSSLEALRLRVWRLLHGPLEADDAWGRATHAALQGAVVGFLLLAVLETERRVYDQHEVGGHAPC